MRLRALAWGSLLVVALSARFVFETVLVNRAPAAIAASATILLAALLLALVGMRLPARTMEDRDRTLAAALGVLVWLVPLLVASVRRTDTPSGTEVLFLTTAVWGLLLAAGGIVIARKWSWVRLSLALLGVVGAAGILANWERPSSFSPFVKFPVQEIVILLAGVLFAAGVYLLAGLVRRNGALRSLRALVPSAAAAAVVGGLVLGRHDLAFLLRSDLWSAAVPAALAASVMLLALVECLTETSAETIAAACVLPPVVVSALTVLEQSVGLRGATPIVWAPALAGVAVSIAAAAALYLSEPALTAADVPARRGVARWLSLVAAAFAVVGLVTPDIYVTVRGILSGGPFGVRFPMLGFETAGGWLAACCVLLVVAWAWERRAVVRKQAFAWALALAVAVAAWWPLHATALHTWTTWIPAEVQQDYGTEYASRTEEPVVDPFEIVALAGAALTGMVLLFRSPAEILDDQEVTEP